jgi:hypothetical protein
MNIPPPPADMLILQMDDGRIDIPLSEVKPLIPHTCFICPDMTSEWSDVSVGMFEADPDGIHLLSDLRRAPTSSKRHVRRAICKPKKYLRSICQIFARPPGLFAKRRWHRSWEQPI